MNCSNDETKNNTNNDYREKSGEGLEKNSFVNIKENSDSQHSQETNCKAIEMNIEKQNTFSDQQQTKDSGNNNLGVFSLILGIISFFTSLVFIVSIPTGIAGLILGIKSKSKSSVGKAGKAFSIIGLVFTGIFIAISIFVTTLIPSSKTYYGDGYTLNYDKDWSITTLSGGNEAFQYKTEKSFLAPIGKSALSDFSVNFDTNSGKKRLYQAFYDYWNTGSSDGNGLKIFSGSNGFSKLTDDIYYATYTNGASTTQIRGKFILLVSPEKNAVLSFMSNAVENIEDNDEKSLELLKNINIYDQTSTKQDSDSNGTYDDTDLMYDYLDSLSNWNRYSELRKGNLGKINSINGGWRVLNDSEIYWKFRNGQFLWFKSINNLNDNYWYGTTKIYTGKEGLKVAGIDESKLDSLISSAYGTITANDVYTVVCTPTKIVSGGVDRSDTNIPEGTTWTYVWIVIDHGAEGIEAQVLNTGTYEATYYVKIED